MKESANFVHTLYNFVGIIKYRAMNQIAKIEKIAFENIDNVPTQALFNLI
jgi:hypothetical protein